MSETLSESMGPDPVETSVEQPAVARRGESPRRTHHTRGAAPSLKVVTGDVELDEDVDLTSTDTFPAPSGLGRSDYLAGLELRLRELVEIERMRDLEIHRLEAEVELQSSHITELETALFHAERRGDDLDRRWNELAQVYEESAAALVEAGAQLEQIHEQASYKFVLAAGRALRKMPVVYTWLRRVSSLVMAPRVD